MIARLFFPDAVTGAEGGSEDGRGVDDGSWLAGAVVSLSEAAVVGSTSGIALDLPFLLVGVDGRSSGLVEGCDVGVAVVESEGSATGVTTGRVDVELSARAGTTGSVTVDRDGVALTAAVVDDVTELVLLFLDFFFFSPTIDDDSELASFGFCFKS